MMVNSEICGTSLSCTLFSWLPLLLHLLKKRLAKDWSFPWDILRQIFWCVRTTAHRQSEYVLRQSIDGTSCMCSKALRCLANHIKLSFLFKCSASVSMANCMSSNSVQNHLKAFSFISLTKDNTGLIKIYKIKTACMQSPVKTTVQWVNSDDW